MVRQPSTRWQWSCGYRTRVTSFVRPPIRPPIRNASGSTERASNVPMRPVTMRIPSAKAKGRRLQQRVALDIVAAFPPLEADDVVSVSMGVNGEDIRMSPAAQGLFPFSIECKNCERINFWAAWQQAQQNAPTDRAPILVIGRNRQQPIVALAWDRFLELSAHPQPPAAAAPMSVDQGYVHLAKRVRAAADELSAMCAPVLLRAEPDRPDQAGVVRTNTTTQTDLTAETL